MDITMIWVVVGLLILGTIILMTYLASLYRKVGPHQALVVYGFGGTKIVKGGGAFILPMVQSCRELSLELMSFDVAPQQDLYTKQGVAVTVEAVAQIKVKSDRESVLPAAEQVKVQQIEKEQQVKVQEAEINRREKELIATVLKGAEIERQRIETLAAAEKQRLIAEAEGQASSIRAQGEAEA